MMNDMFKVTAEDIEESKKGAFLEFKTGDKPVFMIEEIKEDTATPEKERIIIGCKVIGGEHDGKSYSHFIFANNKRLFISILGCFFTEAEIMGGFDIESIIGRKWTATCKLNPRKNDPTKFYTNWNNLEAVSDVPNMADAMGAPADAKTETEEDDVF